MPEHHPLLDTLFDFWERNNNILVRLLDALPEGGLNARSTPEGATVAELYCHLYYIRFVLVVENAPESFSGDPGPEWVGESDPSRIAEKLEESARIVRDAVRGRLEAGQEMDLHFDHTTHLIQFLLWHEAYHYGQMKLALKISGLPLPDAVAGPISWDTLMDKTQKIVGP